MAGVLSAISGSALAAAVRTAASPPVNNSLPTIGGTAQEGQTLTASNGSWGGVTPIGYAYQWQRCNSSGSACGSIGQATHQNYVASNGDVGRTIRVEVTATNADGTSQALSGATGAIADLGAAPANTKQPNPSGTVQEGQTVTVDNGSWSGGKPITFSYQWQTCTATNPVCTDIAGVTGASYLIGTSQVGSLLRAIVTATNSTGKNSAFSNLTTAVLAKAGSPVNSSLPTISGSASVGQRLQASTGVWTGAANGFSYQWSRCNSNGSGCASVSGATGQSYGVGQADLGMALRVSVTAANSNGSTSATSAASVIAARSVLTARFNAVLRAGQEVVRPKGVPTRAAGHFTAKLTGRTLRWTLTFSHLSGRPTVARLHKGVRGANGVAFKSLCRQCLSPAHGTVTLTASQRDALRRGRTYVNIYTIRNTHGEIRGQINRVS
ncbi:MAG: CHRD domain-containing protein [Actinomycetota bacterium]|nr:CHRD domain-containing protein [Actinomycetota bacterium]